MAKQNSLPSFLDADRVLRLIAHTKSTTMSKLNEGLETIAGHCVRDFTCFGDTKEFLQLSRDGLEELLKNDKLNTTEGQVFENVCKWAEYQCCQKKLEATGENMRQVLGNCLFQIRFPTMTLHEFVLLVPPRKILTSEEERAIFRFLSFTATEINTLEVCQLKFSANKREIDDDVKILGSVISLLEDSQIVDDPPFVCHNDIHNNYFHVDKEITLYSIGFLGPLHEDALYDVCVQIRNHAGTMKFGEVKCKVFARKKQVFHVRFKDPLILKANATGEATYWYQILYAIHGADTLSANVVTKPNDYHDKYLNVGGVSMRFQHFSNQVAELRVSST